MSANKILGEDGSSLLEVMIGMLVIAFGLIGLAPMIVLSIDTNTIARDNNIVSNLIKEKIEYYESLPQDSIPAVPFNASEYNLTVSGAMENDTASAFTYDRSVYIADSSVDASIPGNLYELTVSVSWNDIAGVSRFTEYKTYLIKES